MTTEICDCCDQEMGNGEWFTMGEELKFCHPCCSTGDAKECGAYERFMAEKENAKKTAIEADAAAKAAAVHTTAMTADFGDFVLRLLAASPAWSADTLSCIAEAAESFGLAETDEDGFLKRK